MDEQLEKARYRTRVFLEYWKAMLSEKRYRAWLRRVTNGRTDRIAAFTEEDCELVIAMVEGREWKRINWTEVEAARERCVAPGETLPADGRLCSDAFFANPLWYDTICHRVKMSEAGRAKVRRKKHRRKQRQQAGQQPTSRQRRDQQVQEVRDACPELFVPPGKRKPKGTRLLRETGLLDQLDLLRGRTPEPENV